MPQGTLIAMLATTIDGAKLTLVNFSVNAQNEPLAAIAISRCARSQQQIYCTGTIFHVAARR